MNRNHKQKESLRRNHGEGEHGGGFLERIHQETPRRHSGGAQEASRKHPGGTQEASKRHPKASRAPRRLEEAPGGFGHKIGTLLT